MRVRLTDQALTAVAIARSTAAGATVNAAHLLAGLAAEPDGRAGRRLRARASASAVLVERAPAVPAPNLDVVLRLAAAAAGTRPVDSLDLLAAVVAAGGDDVADLMAAAGYTFEDMLEAAVVDDAAETFLLGSDEQLDPPAAAAVAQARAAGGSAIELLYALAVGPASGLLPEVPELRERQRQALRRPPTVGSGSWDTGVDAVVAAAAVLREGDITTPSELILAALLVGGEGPRALLEPESA
jgi:hypothetical protein